MNHRHDLEDIELDLRRLAAKIGNYIRQDQFNPFHAYISDCVFQVMSTGTYERHKQVSEILYLTICRYGIGINNTIHNTLIDLDFGPTQAQEIVDMIRSKIRVCTYCRYLFFVDTGESHIYVSAADYDEIINAEGHLGFDLGTCEKCHKELMS